MMSDQSPTPTVHHFPRYQPPANAQGIPVADAKTTSYLMKAIRVVGRMRTPRRGLQAPQTVRIKHRRPKFY